MSNANTANGTEKPKILVPEKVSPDGLALLQKTLHVDERKGLSPDQLLEIIPEYEGLIVRSETKVTAAVLKAGKKLKVVARAGVGVDNVGTAMSQSISPHELTRYCRCLCGYATGDNRRQLSFREYQCRSRTYHCSFAGCCSKHS